MFESISNSLPAAADDHRIATLMWVKWTQMIHFDELIQAIQQKRRHPMKFQLGVRMDTDGVLRSYSRYSRAELPEESRHPILLPSDAVLTKLIVSDVHQRIGHSGVAHTLSEVWRNYWIPHGRSVVKKILRRCTVCRRFKSSGFALPPMPAWPAERVSKSAPFEYVGLDYFGPIKVEVRGEPQKMWGCLFTCLVTRAVHIEAVVDCSSQEFLSALIRFVSRRRCPEQIISDNAAQFKLVSILGDKAWKRVPTDASVLSYAAKNGIRWKYTTELAPWSGGHYERLVGIVKSVLRVVIGRRLLSWTDFVTLTVETEAIVNSRPITYVGSDVSDQFAVLRPMDFFGSGPTSVVSPESDLSVSDLGEGGRLLANLWKQRKRYLERLWKTWYDYYLLSLRQKGGFEHRQARGAATRCPREGEVVIVCDDDLPRGSWRFGRVKTLLTSTDNNTRSLEILLPNGMVIKRAVNCVVPLEVVSAEHDDHRTNVQNVPVQDPDSDDEFFGFSAEDVKRTADAINRFDDLE